MRILFTFIFCLAAAPAAADSQVVFENKTVGLKVTKPSGWQFVSAEADVENLNRFERTDENQKRLMMKYYTTPLVAFMKHPEPFDNLNPSFRVKLRPLGELKGLEPTQILNRFLPHFRKMYEDFRLVQPPVSTRVDGLQAGYMRINYTLTSSTGRIYPVSSEAWIVPRDDHFFMIGSGTRQDQSTGTREEIAEIVASLRL